MTTISMLINGEPCAAGNGATFERANPLDGKVATTAPAATVDDARRAVDAAAAAFPAWSALGPGERRALLTRAAQALEAKAEAFAAAMAAETGASAIWAGFNVHLAADALREAAALTTQITVTPSEGDRSAQPLTDADVEALADRAVAPDVASVTPLITGSALLQQQGQVGYRTGITGTTANYADVTNLDLVVGSFFDEQQERSKAKVVVLGPRPVTELFAGNAGEAIGQRIRIGRTTFRVIGVAKPAQNDDVAYLPFDAARSYVLGGTDEVDSVIVAAGSAQAVPAAQQQVTAVLDDRHRITDSTERDFDVRAQQDFIDQASQFLTFLTLFTSAIAGISLIVGGIGVANIMLVSVTERTREIGIRKAIGARRKDILAQFLTEAIVVSVLGGAIGIALGIGIAQMAAGIDLNGQRLQTLVGPDSVLLAFGVSAAIGLFFGSYPAMRAARLNPIEALRYE